MTIVDTVVLAGGDTELGRRALEGMDLTGATVIAADSGVHLADAVGLDVDVAVGDFDSIEPDRLAVLEASGTTEVRRHPADKDAIDLALALDTALALDIALALDTAVEGAPATGSRVLVAGIEGQRPDFILANQLLVASERYRPLDRQIALVGAAAWVVTDGLALSPASGTTVSLVPVHGPAVVSLDGVRWPLTRATLEPGTTWGLSNEAAGAVHVSVHAGTVLVFELVQP